MNIAIIGGAIVIGLSLIQDGSGTVYLVGAIITIRGITWLCKKVTATINLDCSQIIDFAGWSIAGVSIVKLLQNAKIGSVHVLDIISGIGETFDKIKMVLERADQFADKLLFWQ